MEENPASLAAAESLREVDAAVDPVAAAAADLADADADAEEVLTAWAKRRDAAVADAAASAKLFSIV